MSRHEVDEVSGIQTGTQLIIGDHEPTRKATHGRGMAKSSPHNQTQIYSDTIHCPLRMLPIIGC